MACDWLAELESLGVEDLSAVDATDLVYEPLPTPVDVEDEQPVSDLEMPVSEVVDAEEIQELDERDDLDFLEDIIPADEQDD